MRDIQWKIAMARMQDANMAAGAILVKALGAPRRTGRLRAALIARSL
jgi:hypothetical protein